MKNYKKRDIIVVIVCFVLGLCLMGYDAYKYQYWGASIEYNYAWEEQLKEYLTWDYYESASGLKIPEEFLNQMKSNLSKTVTPVEEEIPEPEVEKPVVQPKVAPVASVAKPAPVKDKYADVMNVRLSKGRRNEIKAFCTNCGVTVTQYIESSFEYLAKEVAAGNIVISKGGITKISN